MIFNIQKPLKGKDILNLINQKQVYGYYLDQSIDLNKLNRCPFHDDSTPSLSFYNNGDYLKYKCFGCGANGNIFEFIKQKFNLDYGESINKLRKDFSIGEQYSSNTTTNKLLLFSNKFGSLQNTISGKRTEIYPTFRNWTKLDYDYWTGRYNIPLSLLDYYNIKPCSVVYYRSKEGIYQQYAVHSDNNPIYHYDIGGSSKIYRPLNSKKGKWFQNSDSWDIQGIEQLPERGKRLFITSSLKDVIVLRLLGEYAIAPMGEGILIPDKIMDYLHATWEEIILFYDNDEAGITCAKKHSEYYNINYIYISEEPKDISDFVEYYDLNSGLELIKNLINQKNE